MKLKIKIEMDNAAFEMPHRADEVARILQKYVDEIRADGTEAREAIQSGKGPRWLKDINGNVVGLANVR